MRIMAIVALLLASCAETADEMTPELRNCKRQVLALERTVNEYDQGLERQTGARRLAEKRLTAYRDIVRKLTNVRWGFDPGELTFEIRRGQLVVELPHGVLFAPGEARIEPRGREALRQVATILKSLEGRSFLVAGHTDDVPIAKKKLRANSNWELAAHRAIAVVSYLQREGVDPKQLGAVAYGPHQPIASNATETGRSRNRRIEILIMPTVEEIVPLPDEIGGEAEQPARAAPERP